MKMAHMRPNEMICQYFLLVMLLGAPALGAVVEISWSGEVKAGLSTTFNCSSLCAPNCIYTWAFNGTTVSGSTLTWTPDGSNDTVKLQCTVRHPKTGTSINTTTTVQINNPISVRNIPPQIFPTVGQSFVLQCHDAESEDPQGPSRVVWYKDRQKLTPRDNMQLQQNNLTLRFDSLLPSDAGVYRCETYLPTLMIKIFSSGYRLSFDPWSISISGPDVVFVDSMSEFLCVTSCTVNADCTIGWQFKGGFPVGDLRLRRALLRWSPSVPDTFQNITCIAENRDPERFVEASRTVEVKPKKEPKVFPKSGAKTLQLSELLAALVSLGLLATFQNNEMICF